MWVGCDGQPSAGGGRRTSADAAARTASGSRRRSHGLADQALDDLVLGGVVGVVVVAGGVGRVAVALVEVGGCCGVVVERAVDREAVHGVAEHRRLAVGGVAVVSSSEQPTAPCMW